MKGVRIDDRALDVLMPMHLVFDQTGRIRHAGPAIERMAGALTGRRLGEALRFRRPHLAAEAAEVLARPGRRLMVDLIAANGEAGEDDDRSQRLRAVVVPLPQGGGLMHFSFGPDLARAVRRHLLSANDFSPVDPVLEILYLLEAQSLIRGELKAVTERLDQSLRVAEEEAVTDGLTGLSNRRALDRRLEDLAQKRGSGFGLMHLDLDHFKAVNDTLGHAAGDVVLAEVARILRDETRNGDMVCRVGGDEFVLVFPGCTHRGVLANIAERILARLARPIPYGDEECRISGSIGITMSDDYASPDAESLLLDADAALYRSKNAGRSRYAFHRDDGAPTEPGPPQARRREDADDAEQTFGGAA